MQSEKKVQNQDENPQEIQDKVEEIVEAVVEEPKKKEKKKEKDLQKEFAQLQTDYNESQEQFLRLRAEYDNFRKRSLAEKTSIYSAAVIDTVKAILPVADNMDRAVEQENASPEDVQKGLAMILNQFLSSFEELGVQAVGKVGEPFDPNIHNAVSHIEDESLGEGVISAVLQKGYMLGDKVVRHAMVQVAN